MESKYSVFPGTQIADLTGVEFGRLTAIAPCCRYPRQKEVKTYWHCVCICERRVEIVSGSLTGKNTQSCGCFATESKSARAKGRTHITRMLEERFWEKVDKKTDPDGCWLWTGCKSKQGYGKILAEGKVDKAHRVSYRLAFGAFPEELCVLHRCDTPACVRPEHLFLGTQADNNADMDRKGRRGTSDHSGENNYSARLTLAQVVEIRARAKQGETKLSLSKEFGVHKKHIQRICDGKTWAKALSKMENQNHVS